MPHANQPDLFAYLTPTVHWSSADRQMAMMLLQELLQEAVNAPRLFNPSQTGKEGDNELYIYIRQSSTYQVANNLESQRRQYGLAERARQLGWETVEVIDEDLGKSGGGGIERPGFQKLLAAICEGRVGAVFSLEASRLARNRRDWPRWISRPNRQSLS